MIVSPFVVETRLPPARCCNRPVCRFKQPAYIFEHLIGFLDRYVCVFYSRIRRLDGLPPAIGALIAASVTSIAVSAHSHYKWVNAIKLDKTEEQAAALIEAKKRSAETARATQAYGRGARHPKKGRLVFCKGVQVKYRFNNDHRHEYRVITMCRVLNVCHSGFYAWLHKPLSDRAIEDQRLLVLVRASHAASSGVYGAPRGYKAPRAIAVRPSIIAPNRLQREFTVERPDHAWVTDVTYIRTWQGWLYPAVVIDLFARNVVG